MYELYGYISSLGGPAHNLRQSQSRSDSVLIHMEQVMTDGEGKFHLKLTKVESSNKLMNLNGMEIYIKGKLMKTYLIKFYLTREIERFWCALYCRTSS